MSGAKAKAAGATRGQLILVGVLAAVLVGVIANNFCGSGEAVAAAEPVAPVAALPTRLVSEPIAGATAVPTAGSPFGEFAVDGDWPDKPLDQLVEFDPLAEPAWMAPAADAAGEAMTDNLQELQQAQNAIIFVSGDQRVARMGERDYHVGDAVGRFRITEISSAGIVLSEPVGNADDR